MESIRISRFSQQAGKDPEGRAAGRRSVCSHRGAGQTPATIAIGRFHPIKFVSKIGAGVYNDLRIITDTEEDIRVLCRDLFAGYSRYLELTYGEDAEGNYIDQERSVKQKLNWLLFSLKNMLGDYVDFEICDIQCTGDKPTRTSIERYYVIAYQYSKPIREEWHVMPVGEVIKKMRRKKSKDLEVFLLFLKAFEKAGVDTWYDQGRQFWILNEQFPEELYNDELEPEVAREMRNTMRRYNSGLPAEIAGLIKHSCTEINSDGELIVNLSTLKLINESLTESRPIKNLINAGIELLELGLSLYDFNYVPAEFEDNMGLRFYDQFSIVWEMDMLYSYLEDEVNMYAAEGLFPPCQRYNVIPESKELFVPQYEWPRKLSDFFNYAISHLNEYLK